MYRFSKRSLDNLESCHPDLQILFDEVIKHVDVSIIQGYRSEIEQNKAFDDGKSKLRYPLSKHNTRPSLAVDFVPFPLPDWKQVIDFVYVGGMVIGIARMLFDQKVMKRQVRFGADWKRSDRVSDETFIDALHVEII